MKGIDSQPVAVPTAAQENGDFSNGLPPTDPNFPGFTGTLTDNTVATILQNRKDAQGNTCAAGVAAEGGAPIATGTAYSAIFPGNKIPTACFDPVAQSLAKLYLPPASSASQVITVPNNRDRGDQAQVRVDHSFTNNQKLSIYYYFDDVTTLDPFAKFQSFGAPLGNFGSTYATRNQQLNASHTSTIGSRAVNEVRFSYFREGELKFNTPVKTNAIQDSCGSGTVKNFCFTGQTDAPLVDANGNCLSSPPPPAAPVQPPCPANPADFGIHSGLGSKDLGYVNAFPNYFMGLSTSYLQGSPQHELVRSKSVYLFAQDSWKIKPNLTLNYGVRWELNTPMADAGQKVQAFRPGERSTIFPGIAGNDAAGVTPLGIVFPGDKGVPNGLTSTYYKAFAPRLGLNWSPGSRDGWLAKLTGGPGKTSVGLGYGIFYNPIEQLVLEQFSAEPPFGGSESITGSLQQTPFVDQTGGVHPNPFTGVLNPPRRQPLDWSRFLGSTYFGDFQPHMRSQYSDQYNFTIKRELPGDILLQLGYVGSQGHRLLAIYEVNETNPAICLAIAAMAAANPANVLSAPAAAGGKPTTCGPFSEDSTFFIPNGTPIPTGGFLLPYNAGAGGLTVSAGSLNVPGGGITLTGLRKYSSPFCQPLTGSGCPGTPPIVGIFAEDTVAKSNYNSLQALFENRFSHGLQFQASYTWSKTLDNASSFEDALNPFSFNKTYGLSKYDARHRFVFNFVWDLPVPKYSGFKGRLFDGWEISGIETLQSGFPVRITSQADNELLDSTFNFEAPGEPNLVAPFHTQDIRKNGGLVFNPALFDNNIQSTSDPTGVPLGSIGTAPRSICCGPGIYNTDLSFNKSTQLGERLRMELRGDIFNIWNHAQFTSVDGNVGDTTFGQVLHVRDPRLVQFALKFHF